MTEREHWREIYQREMQSAMKAYCYTCRQPAGKPCVKVRGKRGEVAAAPHSARVRFAKSAPTW